MSGISEFWLHPHFRDMKLLRAQFTKHRYELHSHPTYVIALITEGCERLRIGRQTVIAPAGSIAIVNPEECHDGEAASEHGWAYRTFYPSVSLMTAISEELLSENAPVFSNTIINDGELAKSLELAHVVSTSGDSLLAEEAMLIALRRMVQNYRIDKPHKVTADLSGTERRFEIYTELVQKNLSSNIDLQSLAAAGGVTRFQVIRDIKKSAGVTPATFIRVRRLRRAAFLIEQGETLAQAAFEAGFVDQSHMSRTFRAMQGITPKTFQLAFEICGIDSKVNV